MDETLKIRDFYKKFVRSGLNVFPELSKFKKYQRLDESQYKKIVKRYLTVYFNEVYFLDRPFYFFFGGIIEKVRCGNWIRQNKETKRIDIAKHAIGLFWYNRPSPRFWFSIDIRKVKGSTNIIPKIEEQWKNENDIMTLQLSKNKKRELKEQAKLFKLV